MNSSLKVTLFVILFEMTNAGCSQTPEGAPVSTQVVDVALDTIAIASGKAYAVSGSPHTGGVNTRMELNVLGLMTCHTATSRNVFFEILNDEKKTLASGALNANWQAILNANLTTGQRYLVILKSERSGKSLGQFSLLYSGIAPWQIQVTALCPS